MRDEEAARTAAAEGARAAQHAQLLAGLGARSPARPPGCREGVARTNAAAAVTLEEAPERSSMLVVAPRWTKSRMMDLPAPFPRSARPADREIPGTGCVYLGQAWRVVVARLRFPRG